jgi:glycosyltransferase involved in cell wall biosynthesis
MFLIVQIPCFNEELTLPRVLAGIPRQIPGVNRVDVMVVDDGSSDATAETARRLGVEHVVRHKTNTGLAGAFRSGLDRALALGADIIVNMDGDNQYDGKDIPRLIQPILDGKADIVIGDRQADRNPHFSPMKRKLQKFGSFVVRLFSSTQAPDAVSGFRALSREAAYRINIVSSFSYTIEMVIQAGRKKLAIASVPIETNAPLRESRLFKSIPQFIQRSATTVLRMYAMYKPLRAFVYIGAIIVAIGLLPIIRFLVLFAMGDSAGHVQSLVLGAGLSTIGILTFLIGILGDLIGFNRQLLEMTLEKVRRIEAQIEWEKRAFTAFERNPPKIIADEEGERKAHIRIAEG